MAAWEMAIDFGTSNTTVAMRTATGAPEVVEISNSRYLPSVVYLEQDGALTGDGRVHMIETSR
ncbi:hypothetical protein [Dactylosporangium sp. NPDC000521]|uniref:hypothetical protein n=1 Tax=Dactylosporangium sp. NPDC000521 TaxID=3363975 RepID=UPI0036C5FFF0